MKPQIVLATFVVCMVAWVTPAYGYFETNDQPLAREWWFSTFPPTASCSACHHPGTMQVNSFGPHGGYTATTRACATCHSLHDAIGSIALLPGDTITDTCEVCHDGTGGQGVYGALAHRSVPVGAEHSTETTNVVPGGSAGTGGSMVMDFGGLNGTLTCGDCHSPHGADTVTPFLGERQRQVGVGIQSIYTSDRLLRRKPGGTATAVDDYGSDWCLACHAGRASGVAGLMNHPVESSITRPSPQVPYNYRELGIVDVGSYPTSSTVLGPAGIVEEILFVSVVDYNRAYLMPYPRTGAQAGHLPICQQCHEDTRNVGTLTADGTQASPTEAIVTIGDGSVATDNPRFQNFPHETEGYRLLVEAETTYSTDDLCLNCHPPVALP